MPRKKRDRFVDVKSEVDLAEIKAGLKKDFLFFASFCFPHYINVPFDTFHREITDIIEDENEKKALILPRGFGKTTLGMLILLWHILTKDNHYIVVVGNNLDKAKQNYILPIKYEIENNSMLKTFFGGSGDLIGNIWGMEKLEFQIRDEEGNTQMKCIQPFGVGQSIRGTRYLQYRPDFILADDIEDDQQVKNAGRREEIKNYFYEQVYPALDRKGDVYSDAVFGAKPKLVVIGTILHYDSFLINLEQFNGKGWSVYKRGCWYTDEKGVRQSLWSTRYTLEYWDEIFNKFKEEGRERSFLQEYLNEVLNDDDRDIKTSKIQYYNLENAEEVRKSLDVYIGVDLALHGSGQSLKLISRLDFNAIVVIGIDTKTGNVFVLDVDKFKTQDIYETINRAFEMATKWLPKRIFFEKIGMQRWFETLLLNRMNETGIFFTTKEISHHSTQKEERIRMSVKLIVEQGRLFLPTGEKGMLVYDELFQFPLGKHDDVIDALALTIIGSSVRLSFMDKLDKAMKETKHKTSHLLDWLKKKIQTEDEEDGVWDNGDEEDRSEHYYV